MLVRTALERPNEYPQSMFCAEIWKISDFFLSENFQFLEVKFSIYLKRRVFIMTKPFFQTSELHGLVRACAVFFENLSRSKLWSEWSVNAKTRIYGPCHVKKCLWAYADTKGPDQSAHRPVQLGPSMSTYRIFGYCRTERSIVKFLIRLYTVDPRYLNLAYLE